MVRKAREKSSTGIYHIMLRGINKQDIFNDDEDRMKFIETLEKYKKVSEYEVYGYCLMSNHIHLLIKEGKEPISNTMKRIGVSYVYWYNIKYERYGHLFQDRYKSEKVEDDKYLMVVLRYIHQNPLKAGMVESIDKYKWSSYGDYVEGKSTLINIGFIYNILNTNLNKAKDIFREFMNEVNEDKCLDVNFRKRPMSDEEAKKIIKETVHLDNPQMLQQMSKTERDAIIRKLKEKDISIRQLARITGLGRRVIEKA
ncbi:transposase [Wukongibacter baidiensis]|uniref:transposase n=1 Tax=Wukongibacter baidiensis TaxID=1723361 RepID=UPI003D7FCB1D